MDSYSDLDPAQEQDKEVFNNLLSAGMFVIREKKIFFAFFGS